MLLGVEVVFGQRLGLLEVIPSGPGDEERFVAVRLGAGVADPAFLGHVELAAQFPVAGLDEVGAGVFRRDRDVAEFPFLRLVAAALRAARSTSAIPGSSTFSSASIASSLRWRSQTCSQSWRLRRPLSL